MSAAGSLPIAPTQLDVSASGLGIDEEDASQKVVALDEKIAELTRKQARDAGLSPHNESHLIFLRHHRHFEEYKARTGQDIVIVIKPQGAVRTRRGPKTKITEATPAHAGELFAFAAQTGQAVRLATPKEIKAYRDHNEAERLHAQGIQATAATAIAQAQLKAIMGQAVAVNNPALPQSTPPVAPAPDFGAPDPGADIPDMSESFDTATAGTAGPPDTPPPATEGLDERMNDIGNAAQRQLLIENGFTSLEQVADSDVATLSKIKGIGNVTGAQLITEATAIVEDAKDEEGG